MDLMHFFIPTRNRIGNQVTVRNLPKILHPWITIVCPQSEVLAHRADWPDVQVLAQPDHIETIGAKREWIFKEAARGIDFAWQLDDDLKFKILDNFNRFVKPRDEDSFAASLLLIHDRYRRHEKYEVIGLGTSYFAPKGGVRDNYHLGFAFGFSENARDSLEMNRLDVFEDIDYTLQVLREGIKNCVCYDVVVDQVKADAPGGVTGERTSETIRRDLDRLISYHPGIVSEKPLRPGAHPAAITKVLWSRAAKEGGLK